jgi:hypothetical protein
MEGTDYLIHPVVTWEYMKKVQNQDTVPLVLSIWVLPFQTMVRMKSRLLQENSKISKTDPDSIHALTDKSALILGSHSSCFGGVRES